MGEPGALATGGGALPLEALEGDGSEPEDDDFPFDSREVREGEEVSVVSEGAAMELLPMPLPLLPMPLPLLPMLTPLPLLLSLLPMLMPLPLLPMLLSLLPMLNPPPLLAIPLPLLLMPLPGLSLGE